MKMSILMLAMISIITTLVFAPEISYAINKCIDANGKVLYTESECKGNQKQQTVNIREKHSAPNHSTIEIKSAIALLEAASQFNASIQIASRTSRIALSGPLANLQNIKHKADSVEVTQCLKPAKTFLISGMNACIRAFYSFMDEEDRKSKLSISSCSTNFQLAMLKLDQYVKIGCQ